MIMSSSEMKQITRQTLTVSAPGKERYGKAHITAICCGLIMVAIGCALYTQALWADEPENAIATASVATTQADEPAAAVNEKPSQAPARKSGLPAGWKPPAMPEPTPFSSQKIDAEIAKELKERWGVELLGIRNAAAGNFMDFRFKVVDAEKSLPLFDHRIKPYVIAEKSDIKLPVPMAAKIGAFRPTNRGKNIKADKIYYMLFGNPDRHVKTGEKVTVVIGDFKVEHLVVN
jgi:hypothetical protein